jgi:KUP system potassium uptake protein
MHNLQHNHVLHQHVVLLTAVTSDVPRVPPQERLQVRPLGHGLTRIIATFGFHERADLMAALRLARDEGLDIDVDGASFFLNHVTLLPERGRGMALWRKQLFVGLQRNSTSPARHFGLPSDRVIEVGAHVRF